MGNCNGSDISHSSCLSQDCRVNDPTNTDLTVPPQSQIGEHQEPRSAARDESAEKHCNIGGEGDADAREVNITRQAAEKRPEELADISTCLKFILPFLHKQSILELLQVCSDWATNCGVIEALTPKKLLLSRNMFNAIEEGGSGAQRALLLLSTARHVKTSAALLVDKRIIRLIGEICASVDALHIMRASSIIGTQKIDCLCELSIGAIGYSSSCTDASITCLLQSTGRHLRVLKLRQIHSISWKILAVIADSCQQLRKLSIVSCDNIRRQSMSLKEASEQLQRTITANASCIAEVDLRYAFEMNDFVLRKMFGLIHKRKLLMFLCSRTEPDHVELHLQNTAHGVHNTASSSLGENIMPTLSLNVWDDFIDHFHFSEVIFLDHTCWREQMIKHSGRKDHHSETNPPFRSYCSDSVDVQFPESK